VAAKSYRRWAGIGREPPTGCCGRRHFSGKNRIGRQHRTFLLQHLQSIKNNYHYQDILVIDNDGNLRLSLSGRQENISNDSIFHQTKFGKSRQVPLQVALRRYLWMRNLVA
jgi:hypothetical protein